MHRRQILAGLATLAAFPALAQFAGPSAQGAAASVAAAREARIGTYLTLEGSLVQHLREDYYTFSDGLHDIRVEIEADTFAGRPVTPETRLRITGEVDTGLRGRYVWVSALEIL
jgi:uncharacterized protein (TIGR00156 family)